MKFCTKIFILNIVILLNLLCLNNAEMIAENVVLAVNCGGEAFRDSKDIEYLEDMYFDNGQTSDFGSQFEIKNTNDQAPYQTERWSEKDITYSLPLTDGKYVLVLKFSEVYFNSQNEKVFNVNIGNRLVIGQLDIFTKVGKSTAYDEFIEFEVKNSRVFIGGKLVDNAYNSDSQSVIVIFKKGERDNPKINAIVVVKGGMQDTDYENFKDQMEELEKAKQEKERKQREIKKRNSLHYDFEEFEEDYVDPDVVEKKSILSSPLTLISIGLIMYIFYIIFLRKSSISNEDIDKED